MSDHVASTTTGDDAHGDSAAEATSSRRGLLGKGAIAAAVAAAAGIATASRADAADGNSLIIGAEGQTAQSPTELKATTNFAGLTLLVNDQTAYSADSVAYQGALGGFSNARAGVYGFTDGTDVNKSFGVVGWAPKGTGVYGRHDSTVSPGDGVVGESDGGFGVSGIGSSGGVYGENSSGSILAPGVVGKSAGGAGVVGDGAAADFQAAGSGRIWLTAAGVANPPTGGAVGAIARDNAGNLWYCHTAGQWRKLTGATAAGAFHAINPVRVYDSRASAPTPGVMAPNSNRVVSIKDGRNSAGTVTAADVVPAGATAVTFNVTVTGTTGANYLSVVPGNAAAFTTSTLNWNGGYDIANGGVVKLDNNRQIKVFMGDQSGSAHIIIDITGYYL